MSKGPASLEIHLHLTNGSVSKFAQKDAALIKKALSDLNPVRLFNEPWFVIETSGSLSFFPNAQIARVDLITDIDMEWRHPSLSKGDSVSEITAEEFKARYKPDKDAGLSRKKSRKSGDILQGFAHVLMTGGQRVIVEICRTITSTMEQRDTAKMFLPDHAFFAPRIGGGYFFLNTANIIRLDLLPGQPDLALFAWQADPLRG